MIGQLVDGVALAIGLAFMLAAPLFIAGLAARLALKLIRGISWLKLTEGKLTHPTEPELGPLRVECRPPWWYVVDDELGEAWGPYPTSRAAREKLDALMDAARRAKELFDRRAMQ